MASAKRPDWSQPLPRPLVIPEVMTLKTLADVRKLLGHIPKEVRVRVALLSPMTVAVGTPARADASKK